jgi:hypothetical protein
MVVEAAVFYRRAMSHQVGHLIRRLQVFKRKHLAAEMGLAVAGIMHSRLVLVAAAAQEGLVTMNKLTL